MAHWEYMTFDLVKRKTEIEGLNRLGREGWEAVAMVSSWGVGWRFVHPIVLLKRLRPDDVEGRPDDVVGSIAANGTEREAITTP